MRHMSWRQFILVLGLHTTEEIKTAGFSLYWAESAKQISNKGDLSAYWMGISSEGDFLGTPPSYTHIRGPILRLCHRLITCSIDGRSQAPKKVIVTDLFYLRGIDFGSVNIPYLLARYLRLFALGRKRGVMISEVDEGASAVPAPVQAPQPPPVTGPTRTMIQRLGRLDEDVYGLQRALGE
ncbi:hypothetical protein Tco_0183195 [Tanacetum coccineum]